MIAQLRSELFKQRTTRTNLWLLLSMVPLIGGVVVLHMVTLPIPALTGREGQLKIFGLGTTFGLIFAGLLGAMAITSEIRNGMIRPTLLATPDRPRVIVAKVLASALAGALFGVIAEAVALGAGGVALVERGVSLAPTGADSVQLVIGGGVAAGFWAAIGVGFGAIVRNQVAAAVGLVVWLLFIEMTLIGSLPAMGKFLPGATGAALAGAMLQQTARYLLAPAIGAVLIAGYAAVAATAGAIAIARRDIT